ncbi:hypothetical protein N7532_005838 [Penicillium argentinense]|uniref:Myb-like domain-containing protein n=1 Tax=Penicillium argentinense TaxID=1131581 RepID=A0A9W9KBD4_9EURO|nr:uncharacterized protein N7532_005838 [Penicillium argentinense]KAJ5098837.1 hypothetical protein N7532_005838 [Penicillium argentinense]
MSSASFRLESFRPWNPFRDKAQPVRDSPDIYRYPSPVSITTTPSHSDSSDSASKSQKNHSHKPERHPLPARPPVEVCLDGGPHSDPQTSRREPAELGRTASADIYRGNFDSDEILQSEGLSAAEDVDSAMISADIRLGAEHQSLGVESGDLEPAAIPGQHPQARDSGNQTQTGSVPGNEAIVPAILNDHDFPDAEQIQATEDITGITTRPNQRSSNCTRSLSKDSTLQRRRRNAKGTVDLDRQSSKIRKPAGAGNTNTTRGSGRSNKGPRRRKSVLFPDVRAQFLALPVEDRLQFLSWLFEGALPHCTSTRANTDVASMSRCISSQDADISNDCDQSLNTDLVDEQHPHTRKGLPFSMEESRLLVDLREEQRLSWSEATRRFGQKFPGRSKGSIQVYWSTTLKKQRQSLLEAT